jgi:hypothetical protein
MRAAGRALDTSSILKITQGGQGKEEEEDGDEEEEEEEEEEKLVALALLNIITAFS